MGDARLRKKIVFWQQAVTGQLVMGCPEEYPAPPFFNKIVCRTAHEAEFYSQMMRSQEAMRESMIDEKRQRIESELIRNLRSHMHHQMANARDWKNREFIRLFLARQEEMIDKTRTKRESYLHSEAYEHGH